MIEIPQPKENKALNSPLREKTKHIRNGIAKWLIKNFPDLSANQITDLGSDLVNWGSRCVLVAKLLHFKKPIPLGAALMTIGSTLDAIDGEVAREKQTTSMKSALNDTDNDREQERSMGEKRIISAILSGKYWTAAATISTVLTSAIPSYERAKVEEELGFNVPESGAKWITFLGTRPARAVLGILASVFPDAQGFIDTISALGNVFTSLERASILKKAKEGRLKGEADKYTQELGALKSEALKKIIIKNATEVFIITTLCLLPHFLSKIKRNSNSQ